MDHEKFHYWKEQVINSAEVRYLWYMQNKETRQAVHFHGSVYDQSSEFGKICARMANHFGFITMGIELHSPTPLYEGQKPITNCKVMGGECYIDGTSLYAREALGHINPNGGNDAQIWSVLGSFWRSHFQQEDASNEPA
jgi:hypothetical protein